MICKRFALNKHCNDNKNITCLIRACKLAGFTSIFFFINRNFQSSISSLIKNILTKSVELIFT